LQLIGQSGQGLTARGAKFSQGSQMVFKNQQSRIELHRSKHLHRELWPEGGE